MEFRMVSGSGMTKTEYVLRCVKGCAEMIGFCDVSRENNHFPIRNYRIDKIGDTTDECFLPYTSPFLVYMGNYHD